MTRPLRERPGYLLVLLAAAVVLPMVVATVLFRPAVTWSLEARSVDAYTVSDDDRFLELHYTGAAIDCSRLDEATAIEHEDRVEIQIVEGRRADVEHCSTLAVPATATVRLDEPLGDRVVLDATTLGALIPPRPD